MLELCFGLAASPANMTWTTLFSRFARRYRSCYSTFDAFVPKETDYSKILNNCYLLGIDTELIVRKKELRDQQSLASKTEKAIKKDPLFKQYYLGKSDAELDANDLEYRISELEKELSEFKVSNNYHELEKEADEKSYEKKTLENKRVLLSNYIKNIETSLKETNEVKEEKLLKIYEAAQVEIPEMVKRNLDEVLKFHDDLLTSRNTRLRKELNRQRDELQDIDENIEILGKRMDELRIKAELIEQDKETEEYLEIETEYLKKLRNQYRNYAKKFYPKKRSGLVINNWSVKSSFN